MKPDKEHGIDAVNQEYKKYEQVKKDQSYHLAEKEGQDLFDEDYQIKTCDMRLFYEGDWFFHY